MVWFRDTIIDWVIVVAAFALVILDWRFLPLSWLVIGNRQHALAILMHEGAHRNIHKYALVNDAATALFTAWPLAMPFTGYRKFHLAHHASLNSHLDPEQEFKRQHPSYLGPRSRWWIAADLAADLCLASLNEIWTLYSMMGRNARRSELAMLAVLWLCLIAAFAAIGHWWIPVLWLASFGSVAWAHNRVRSWMEHSGAPEIETHSIALPFLVDVVLRPHNVGKHAEHHSHPKIPYWRLK